MSCHNCDHTMQNVGHAVLWCPRCGSIKWGKFDDYASDVPKIAFRAQKSVEALNVFLENERFREAISDFPDLATALGLEDLRECLHGQPTQET